MGFYPLYILGYIIGFIYLNIQYRSKEEREKVLKEQYDDDYYEVFHENVFAAILLIGVLVLIFGLVYVLFLR